MSATVISPLDEARLGPDVRVASRTIDRFARAHDASHYLLVPDAVLVPQDAAAVARVFDAVRAAGRSLTFRSGGTSLSGQGVTGDVMVDTRSAFRRITVAPDGASVAAQPGATVRQVNTRLARFGRKLGPDPASEIACTIGGVVADNSSGMACGIVENSYRTIESMLLVLPSGTILDTGAPDAAQQLRDREPAIFRDLEHLRDRLRGDPVHTAEIARQFSMKNTMGYGLNALIDFDDPVRILEHLVIGSEGTLAFVAEARFRTIPIQPHASTGLLVFDTLPAAMAALPGLTALGLATIELMDAASLRVAQGLSTVPDVIADIDVRGHAALLIEVHAATAAALAAGTTAALAHVATLPLTTPARMTEDPVERGELWTVRKGLYTAVAGARPSGTTALLEDIAVPVERLLGVCEGLTALFAKHHYEGCVIFGHAKDGNVHFLINERFDDHAALRRYEAFTEDLVELVLAQGGTLKAEHGTGRIMAPFVRRQYGDVLTDMMWEIKRLIDPDGILNPGVVLSDVETSYLDDLKLVPTVEHEIDRCVECGYCEPTCPSKDVTLTPRQRIVLRRDVAAALHRGEVDVAAEIVRDYDYDAVQTCAVDGMCGVACPVDINTGDLVRRLRAEDDNRFEEGVWNLAAKHWGAVTRGGGLALTVAKALPAPLVTGVTRVGRALLGADTVPLYDEGLPGGGSRALPAADPLDAQAVLFGSCIGTMFGAEPGGSLVVGHGLRGGVGEDGLGAAGVGDGDGGVDEGGVGEGGVAATGAIGSRNAVQVLLQRAGIAYAVPPDAGTLCCGTPWKSKGQLDGYATMAERVLPALWRASHEGRLPVVCDAASCTEGLHVMLAKAVGEHPEYARLRIEDATTFLAREALPKLTVRNRIRSIAVHPTCSTTQLGATGALRALAAAIADEVYVPEGWGCCAFAGDRGMLHPELTASATAVEAAELAEADAARRRAVSERSETKGASLAQEPRGGFDAYVSANRTCELGMSRATGKPYRHVVEVLEELTRP